MTDWPGGISAITLFVEDLEASKAFYQRAFGLPVFYEDPNSAVFQFNDTRRSTCWTSTRRRR